MSDKKRRFSLDEDFMNFKTDDIVYGFMKSIASAKPIEESYDKYEEYLTK